MTPVVPLGLVDVVLLALLAWAAVVILPKKVRKLLARLRAGTPASGPATAAAPSAPPSSAEHGKAE